MNDTNDTQTGLASPLEGTTPGPWVARGESIVAHRPHVCGGYNEEPVLSLTRSPRERLANARLIAAAPALAASHAELVRALEFALPELDDTAATVALAALANARKIGGEG